MCILKNAAALVSACLLSVSAYARTPEHTHDDLECWSESSDAHTYIVSMSLGERTTERMQTEIYRLEEGTLPQDENILLTTEASYGETVGASGEPALVVGGVDQESPNSLSFEMFVAGLAKSDIERILPASERDGGALMPRDFVGRLNVRRGDELEGITMRCTYLRSVYLN